MENALEICHAFLNGEIDHSPGHCAPLDPESAIIKDILLEFNKRGILTTQSQPYEHTYIPEDGETWVQAPFVTGVGRMADVRKLVKNAIHFGFKYMTLFYTSESKEHRFMPANTESIEMSGSYCQDQKYIPFTGLDENQLESEFTATTLLWDLEQEFDLVLFIIAETSLQDGYIPTLKEDNSFFNRLLEDL